MNETTKQCHCSYMSLPFIKKQETKCQILWPKNKHFVSPGMLHDIQDICTKLSNKTWDLREMYLLALYKLCNTQNYIWCFSLYTGSHLSCRYRQWVFAGTENTAVSWTSVLQAMLPRLFISDLRKWDRQWWKEISGKKQSLPQNGVKRSHFMTRW